MGGSTTYGSKLHESIVLLCPRDTTMLVVDSTRKGHVIYAAENYYTLLYTTVCNVYVRWLFLYF